jgi:hypothetical protein
VTFEAVEAPSTEKATEIAEACDIWYEHDAHFQFVDIYLMSYGKDIKQRIAEIEKVCAQPQLTTSIFIDMRDPLAPVAYKELLGSDCFYAGFMPLSAGHEYIILHRPGATAPRPEEMRLTDHTKETLLGLGVDVSGIPLLPSQDGE